MFERRELLEDDLDRLYSLRDLLISRARGNTEDNFQYQQLRDYLFRNASLREVLPRFLRRYLTLDSFWAFIKGEYPSYSQRETYLRQQFQESISVLEGANQGSNNGPTQAAEIPLQDSWEREPYTSASANREQKHPYVMAQATANFTEYWPSGIVGRPRLIGEKLWTGSVDIRLENVGEATALFVQAALSIGGTVYRVIQDNNNETINSVQPGAGSELMRFVPPAEALLVPWAGDHEDGEITVTYRDLNGQQERIVQRVRIRPISTVVEPLGPPMRTVGETQVPPVASRPEPDIDTARRESATTKTRVAVFLTALPVEYAAVREHLRSETILEDVHPQGTIYEYGIFESGNQRWKVCLVEVGAGNQGAAAEAERAIQHFNPEVAMFVGVAGGIKDVGLGDVVAANKVYGYHAGKALQDFQPRPEVGSSSYRMIERARAEARRDNWRARIPSTKQEKTPRVRVGPIAAGEQVVASADSPTHRFIRNNYSDAIAVEMEGIGFLRALHANQDVLALVIRGISDLIDDKLHTDAEGWQVIASQHASAFAFEVLSKI